MGSVRAANLCCCRGAIVNRYRLSFVIHEPSQDTEDKCLAEVPELPGCRAWGDTPAEALHILEGVAEAFIQSYLEHGHQLPVGVAVTPVVTGEVGEVQVIA